MRIVEGTKSRKLDGPKRVLLLLHFYYVFFAKNDLLPVGVGH